MTEENKSFLLPINLKLDLTTIKDKQIQKQISLYHYDLLLNSKLEEIKIEKKTINKKKINCKSKIREDSLKIINIYLIKLKEALLIEYKMDKIINKLKIIFPNAFSIKLDETLKFFLSKYIFIEINENNNLFNKEFEKWDFLKYLKSNNYKYFPLIEYFKLLNKKTFNCLQFSINLFYKSLFICKMDIINRNDLCPLLFLINNYEIMLSLTNPILKNNNLISKFEILGNIFLEIKFEEINEIKPKYKLFNKLNKSPIEFREIIHNYIIKNGLINIVNLINPNGDDIYLEKRGINYIVIKKSELIIYLKIKKEKYIIFSNKINFIN